MVAHRDDFLTYRKLVDKLIADSTYHPLPAGVDRDEAMNAIRRECNRRRIYPAIRCCNRTVKLVNEFKEDRKWGIREANNAVFRH
jgi:hypothetical protein